MSYFRVDRCIRLILKTEVFTSKNTALGCFSFSPPCAVWKYDQAEVLQQRAVGKETIEVDLVHPLRCRVCSDETRS